MFYSCPWICTCFYFSFILPELWEFKVWIWKKIRSGFGNVKILSHFWELGWFLYIFRIVIQCLTFLMLKICAKSQRIQMFELEYRRAFLDIFLSRGWRRSHMGWACFCISFHTLFPFSYPLSPFAWFNVFFYFSFFILTYLFFLMILKI